MSAIAARRAASISRLAVEQFDALVIGGGINGAGIARDAALRGLRVALVEKDDFASGTSSRSSRLIHGGVRYLEHGHLHLVFESSRERRTLLRVAPHLVRPLPFTWPVYRGARMSRFKLGLGLTLYDMLALFRNVGNHDRLSAQGVLAAEPALRADALLGGARYWDASTDDARLTLANALGAESAGAVVVNYCRAAGWTSDGVSPGLAATGSGDHGPIGGQHGRGGVVDVEDTLTGLRVAVRARCVINAAGPWTDDVDVSLANHPTVGGTSSIRGSVGAHVAVPRDRVGNRHAVTLIAPQDGRVMFVLPAGNCTIIGTTETPARESPDHVRASREEVRYLLQACNAHFPGAELRDDDVVAAWAGIRPLAASRAHGDAGSASREHTITTSDRGVLSVTGGKLTTYRAMAEEVVDRAIRVIAKREGGTRPRELGNASTTAHVPLPGGGGGGALDSLEGERSAATEATGNAGVASRLVSAHGSGWRDVWLWTRGDPSLAELIEPTLAYSMAEAVHAVEREHAASLGDVLLRRTHLAFETRDHGLEAARRIASVIGPRLDWDGPRIVAELGRYEREVERLNCG